MPFRRILNTSVRIDDHDEILTVMEANEKLQAGVVKDVT